MTIPQPIPATRILFVGDHADEQQRVWEAGIAADSTGAADCRVVDELAFAGAESDGGAVPEADGDQADGDQADGDQADGDQADGDQADGGQADGVQADGVQADGDALLIVLTSFGASALGLALALADEHTRASRRSVTPAVTLAVEPPADADPDAARRVHRWLCFACAQRDGVQAVSLARAASKNPANSSILVDAGVRARLREHGEYVSIACRELALDRRTVRDAVASAMLARVFDDDGVGPEPTELDRAIGAWLDRPGAAVDAWRESWRAATDLRGLARAIRWARVWAEVARVWLVRERLRSDQTVSDRAEFGRRLAAREDRARRSRRRRWLGSSIAIGGLLAALVFGLRADSADVAVPLVSLALLGGAAITLFLAISSRLGSGFDIDHRALGDFRVRVAKLDDRVRAIEELSRTIGGEIARLEAIMARARELQRSLGIDPVLERSLDADDPEIAAAGDALCRAWLDGGDDAPRAIDRFERIAGELACAMLEGAAGPRFDAWIDCLDDDLRGAPEPISAGPVAGHRDGESSLARFSIYGGSLASHAREGGLRCAGRDRLVRIEVEPLGDLAAGPVA